MTTDILIGDCLDILPTLPAEKYHAVITSSPYWSLRSYLPADHPDKAKELGAEKLHDCLGWATGAACGECFVCHLVAVFREIKRVLRSDGTAWLVIGDSYSGSPPGNKDRNRPVKQTTDLGSLAHNGTLAPGLKPKDLAMIPARVALALQADGWWLRSDCIWAKGLSFCPTYSGSVMPESVRDRPSKAHEYVFLLAKSPRYYFDQEAIKEPVIGLPHKPGNNFHPDKVSGPNDRGGNSQWEDTKEREWGSTNGRNPRSVWAINPENFPDSHFAVFPTALVEPMIRAGTPERGCCPACGAPWERVVGKVGVRETHGINKVADMAQGRHGSNSIFNTAQAPITTTLTWRPACSCDAGDPIPATILDPFGGSGTTGLVADRLGRNAVLIELNPVYAEMAQARIKNDNPMFVETPKVASIADQLELLTV